MQYVEIPVPSLKKGEVLIKVEAASINPADCRIQKGLLRPFVPKFPFIPVTDVAGEIVEIGSAVQEFKVGDKVVSKLIFWKAGGLAEYVAASESITAPLPTGVSSADAAGLPVAGLTALQAVKAIGTKFDGTGVGSNILITAASGGIGSYAVQLAKLGNHNVTATCGARNLELVADIGADEALDYKTPEGAALKNLGSHGRVVEVAPNFGNFVASILTLFSKKKLSTVTLSLGMEDLRFLLELVKERKLKTVIDSRHPFEKAADAWEKSLSGHATGKVIVEM
ncbi:unnamed protein product [Triticum turgidum subsp. durum]|uniref:Enoyl reductase (ER) domain-containing protein n=1 Tax=Triticum turgidum subsp. durum TaxID=4567 RepID=A0A9R1NUY1_TRITD|nr:unnamed protein product [Triticum turgidum subsp. durum]